MLQKTAQSDPPSPGKAVAAALEAGLEDASLDLPVMPRVASRVFALAKDPNAEMGDLSELIHSDQSIASHVLRIANSAAYGSGEQIVSLRQAVARLGMNLLGEIAIAVSLQAGIFKSGSFSKQVARLLRHALAAAAYGKEIARMRRRNVEGQFLCGLLHSVGKPIALQLIDRVQTDRQIALASEDAAALADAFEERLARKVVADWRLPRQLQTTTLHYRDYRAAPAFKDECAATWLSRLLASWLLNPRALPAEQVAADSAFAYLNFYPDDVRELFDKREAVMAVVASMEL